ncbi:FAD/NAD(P)-binding protein [Novosphingobium sp. FSW06-99]|uniref:NAD(P)-binding protein n=1 Tax=Novosphingobium sp. FSW06-99 TaxID=1739113 RepID=UPI00076D65FB|nr:FAD/NAD(P)-binding protein [Novosphingobium sp. FSW06-99]KUR78646.1 hypothetical protein AQZ49_07315 [Novosphingobium sp. FSW06-99]
MSGIPASEGVIRRNRLAGTTASSHLLDHKPALYALGSFDSRVTVLSQQTRALNLAWSLIETGIVPVQRSDPPCRIAVVGAGFAGLTFAAGLLRKGAACELYIFEQRDTLLPLQQGSDTRWLHPHIYDWPADGSEASAAMLPVLNWTAARSSDVVVQVLGEWAQIVENEESVHLFCNTRHLQLTPCEQDKRKARIEWVGEKRRAADGTIRETEGAARGSSEVFDAVVLAVGFGLEASKASYWRNETLGQPSLNEPRRTFLLSGQGDGAMIDLLRIRISQFRQDRILEELFGNRAGLVAELKAMREDFLNEATGLFDRFEALLSEKSPHRDDMLAVIAKLDRRLRRDTDVVLQLLVRNVAELLEPATSRMSFQNALLVFLLYRCGGFAPSTEKTQALKARFAIENDTVIERHGVRPLDHLKRMLPDKLFGRIEQQRSTDPKTFGLQTALPMWPGGYFGYTGREQDTGTIGDEQRREWRKEYLPGPTALVATSLCGAIVGVVERMQPAAKHFRVTLHRTLSIHGDDLLQQACDYLGKGLEKASATAGRTFPATAATIGAAYRTRRIVRTLKDVKAEDLQAGMADLKLHEAARKMMPEVRFVLAIPILQPEHRHYAPSPVTAILYLDSRDEAFFLNDDMIGEVCAVLQAWARSVETPNGISLGRLRNVQLEPLLDSACASAAETSGTTALTIVENVEPPLVLREFVLNFDHTDLAPATTDATTPPGA